MEAGRSKSGCLKIRCLAASRFLVYRGWQPLFAESLPGERDEESLGSLIWTLAPFWGLFVHNLIPSQRSYLQYSTLIVVRFNTLILERHKSSIWSSSTGQHWTHFPAQKSSEVPLLVNKLHLVSYDRSAIGPNLPNHLHTSKPLKLIIRKVTHSGHEKVKL